MISSKSLIRVNEEGSYLMTREDEGVCDDNVLPSPSSKDDYLSDIVGSQGLHAAGFELV